MIEEAPLLAFLRRLVEADSPTEHKRLCDAVGNMLVEEAARIGMAVERDAQGEAGDHLILRLAGAGGASALPAVARPSPHPSPVRRERESDAPPRPLPSHGRGRDPREAWEGEGRATSEIRPRNLLLIGHFDTVYPAGTTARRPFRIEGDRAFGPGILDMKGGLALGLFAIAAAQRLRGGALPHDLTFVMNSDEETGSATSRALIEREARGADLALILEPGRPGPALTVGRKGVGIFHLDVEGTEAHAGAEPERGANAILAVAHHAIAAAALANPVLGTTVNPGTVAGGTWPYVVPGTARLGLDIRVPTLAEQHRIEAALAAIARTQPVPRTRTRLTGRFHRPPMEPTPASLALAAEVQRIAADLGFPLGTTTSGGASDGNLTAAAGTPTLDGLGPHGAGAHSGAEHIELPTLFAKCRILARFLAGG